MDTATESVISVPFVGRCPQNSPTCRRILSFAEILVIAVDLPALLFHLSVAVFVFMQIASRNQTFGSAFYRLYTAMSLIEVVHTLDVSRI